LSGNIKNKLKNIFYKILYPVFYFKWKFYSTTNDEINILVGAGLTKFEGWFPTDVHFLDITKESDFKKLFSKRKIDRILAEHVLEHLSSEQLNLMASNFYKYSSNKINIRIAVPDGYHKSKEYINLVKPGGKGEGSFDHKHLFNYRSLSEYFENAGFKSNYIEYWNENNEFFTYYKNDGNGIIRRSFINDKRNTDGSPNYTSLIIDFTK